MKQHNYKKFLASSLALAMASTLVPLPQAQAFQDVSQGQWYYSFVTEMAEAGFVTGTSDSTYSPDESLSVGQFAVMIANGFYGNTVEREKELGYDLWWEPFLKACANRNGLQGTVAEDSNTWSTVVESPINRYNMALMIFNLMGEQQVPLLSDAEIQETLSSLTDTIPEEYQTAVAMSYHYGFLSGKDGGAFDGSAQLLRGEAATVLSALVKSDLIAVERGDTTGQMPEGQMPEGQMPEGQMPEGQMPEGEMGQRPEGMLPEGEMGEGQLPPPDGMTGGMVAQPSTLTVEEALAMADEIISVVGYTAQEGGYPIVDTNQTTFYSNDAIISAPSQGEAFYGQDASFSGNQPSYTNNGDGTISDNVTGLMWQQDPEEKMTWPEAVANLEAFNEAGLGGYSDWRIPTIKELYSLVDFSGLTGMSSSASVPYIDTDYFKFTYGDEAGEARFIDSQILSSTIYGSTTLGDMTTVFGYNFADGRIKGYEIDKDFYCYYVRGNTSYGMNLFVENGDDTITDLATSLMWSQYDSGYYEAGPVSDGTMTWEEALAWVQEANDSALLGYSDWRLPNVKELQSLSDFSHSPLVTGYPSIDPMFYLTPITNYFGEDDYAFYWSGTTHDDLSASSTRYGAASYVIFGNSMGEMNKVMVDAHGSGAQRSDPKTGDRDEYPAPDPNAPQGDEQRVFNMVRLVRDA